jgi:hypothetical protein
MLESITNSNLFNPLVAMGIGYLAFRYGLGENMNDALVSSGIVAGTAFITPMVADQVKKVLSN